MSNKDNRIHLLKNYSTAGTRTLCGILVPEFYAELWDDNPVKYAHVGQHTCKDCDAVLEKGKVAALALEELA